MNFEPQKFFIGLMDFFSILLPGALLTYLLLPELGPAILGARYDSLAGAQAWTVFLFASYVAGHLIFLIGSWLDEIYDWARRYTLNTQIQMVARRGRLLNWPSRAFIRMVFGRERNIAVDRVVEIKKKALGELHAAGAINAFQWSKALLNVKSPSSLATVQRFEADSKFFRCFVIVLLFLLLAWPALFEWPSGGFLLVAGLLLISMWRYMEQRLKSTNQAYWSVITIIAQEGHIALDDPVVAPGTPTHAGGVVFRLRGKKAEYLLVEDNAFKNEWLLPKGHVESGEEHRDTAVREVHEEAGVWARIHGELDDVSFTVDAAVVSTRFFLMEAVGVGLRKDRNRKHKWLASAEAIELATHPETQGLLKAAEIRRQDAA
jgi:8-oxo-dGTP pyrophosphatase MutT (NUDIX family)